MVAEPATTAEELQEAGEHLLDEVMVVVDGGHGHVRGTASPEAIRAATAALARCDARTDQQLGPATGELADAIRILLPVVHEHTHPQWDKRVERLLLAIHDHSWAVEEIVKERGRADVHRQDEPL